MNPLESRKRLLLAESELNRGLLVLEWRALAKEAGALTGQAGSIGSMASAAATLIAGLTSCRRNAGAPAAGKTSWWQTLLKGAGLAGSIWSEFSQPAASR
jgi:hypothetical protein